MHPREAGLGSVTKNDNVSQSLGGNGNSSDTSNSQAKTSTKTSTTSPMSNTGTKIKSGTLVDKIIKLAQNTPILSLPKCVGEVFIRKTNNNGLIVLKSDSSQIDALWGKTVPNFLHWGEANVNFGENVNNRILNIDVCGTPYTGNLKDKWIHYGAYNVLNRLGEFAEKLPSKKFYAMSEIGFLLAMVSHWVSSDDTKLGGFDISQNLYNKFLSTPDLYTLLDNNVIVQNKKRAFYTIYPDNIHVLNIFPGEIIGMNTDRWRWAIYVGNGLAIGVDDSYGYTKETNYGITYRSFSNISSLRVYRLKHPDETGFWEGSPDSTLSLCDYKKYKFANFTNVTDYYLTNEQSGNFLIQDYTKSWVTYSDVLTNNVSDIHSDKEMFPEEEIIAEPVVDTAGETHYLDGVPFSTDSSGMATYQIKSGFYRLVGYEQNKLYPWKFTYVDDTDLQGEFLVDGIDVTQEYNAQANETGYILSNQNTDNATIQINLQTFDTFFSEATYTDENAIKHPIFENNDVQGQTFEFGLGQPYPESSYTGFYIKTNIIYSGSSNKSYITDISLNKSLYNKWLGDISTTTTPVQFTYNASSNAFTNNVDLPAISYNDFTRRTGIAFNISNGNSVVDGDRITISVTYNLYYSGLTDITNPSYPYHSDEIASLTNTNITETCGIALLNSSYFPSDSYFTITRTEFISYTLSLDQIENPFKFFYVQNKDIVMNSSVRPTNISFSDGVDDSFLGKLVQIVSHECGSGISNTYKYLGIGNNAHGWKNEITHSYSGNPNYYGNIANLVIFLTTATVVTNIYWQHGHPKDRVNETSSLITKTNLTDNKVASLYGNLRNYRNVSPMSDPRCPKTKAEWGKYLLIAYLCVTGQFMLPYSMGFQCEWKVYKKYAVDKQTTMELCVIAYNQSYVTSRNSKSGCIYFGTAHSPALLKNESIWGTKIISSKDKTSNLSTTELVDYYLSLSSSLLQNKDYVAIYDYFIEHNTLQGYSGV